MEQEIFRKNYNFKLEEEFFEKNYDYQIRWNREFSKRMTILTLMIKIKIDLPAQDVNFNDADFNLRRHIIIMIIIII